MAGNVAVSPLTDLTFVPFNPIEGDVHQLVPQKLVVTLQHEACMKSADTFFPGTSITSHNGKPS